MAILTTYGPFRVVDHPMKIQSGAAVEPSARHPDQHDQQPDDREQYLRPTLKPDDLQAEFSCIKVKSVTPHDLLWAAAKPASRSGPRDPKTCRQVEVLRATDEVS